MKLALDPADVDFRDEARTWLEANVPTQARPRAGDEMRAFDSTWQRTLFDGGWAGPSWPVESGGRGLSILRQLIWAEEYARARAPWSGTCFVAVNHAGPTLVAAGDRSQREAHLLPILRGEQVWCQGFSEPDAGSDLASLRTRGEIDGDSVVVNGRKLWSSFAHVADYQELLVRTDPDSSRSRGLSFLICDLRSPGLEVRPIITLTGEPEFCEVTYDDVRVPLSNVVGELHRGWEVAMASMVVERGTAFVSDQVQLAQDVEALIETAKTCTGPDGRRPALADDELARRLALAQAETAALRSLTLVSLQREEAGDARPGEPSLVRLYFSELTQRVTRLAFDILGPDALTGGSAPPGALWAYRYAQSFAATIGAGTKDIQRNIIGQQILGLPRS